MRNEVRCDLCGSRLLAARMRWCSTCKSSWVHLSCASQNGNRCAAGHSTLRFVERRTPRAKVKVEVESGTAHLEVEQLQLLVDA